MLVARPGPLKLTFIHADLTLLDVILAKTDENGVLPALAADFVGQ